MDEAAFVANASPWRIVAGLLGCIGFAALGVLLWRSGGIDARIVGGVTIVTFGAFALLGLRRAAQTGPVLRIDADGIRWRLWRDEPVPWHAVAALRELRVQRQRFIAVHLHAPGLNRPHGTAARLNGALGLGDVALSVAGTDRRFAELRAAVCRFAPVPLD